MWESVWQRKSEDQRTGGMDGFGVSDGLKASCFSWREWARRSAVNENMAGEAGTLVSISLSLDCSLPSPVPVIQSQWLRYLCFQEGIAGLTFWEKPWGLHP